MSAPVSVTVSDMSPRLLDDYWTVDQLAEELDIAPITVKRWAALKQGPPATKIGRRVLYRRSSVQAWLARQEQKQAVA
jgi:predicted DNA-binding transcriptional regulator AlpA